MASKKKKVHKHKPSKPHFSVWAHFPTSRTNKGKVVTTTRDGLSKAMRVKGVKWEGSGCGMGYCDESVQTTSCATAKTVMRRVTAYLKKTNGLPRRKGLYPFAGYYDEKGKSRKIGVSGKCPRSIHSRW